MPRRSVQRKQCTAMKKVRDEEGNVLEVRQCKAYAIRGGTVCNKHGGSAPQVKAKAAERLLSLVDPALAELGRILRSKKASDSTKVQAAITVLDRVRETAKVAKSEVSGPDGGAIPIDSADAAALRKLLADPDSARRLDRVAQDLKLVAGADEQATG